ncbi:MAG: protein kinase domain-containing protein [Limisphaerales bacterium]
MPGAQFLEYRLVEPIKVASGEAELWVADGGGRRVVLKFYRWGLHPKAGLTEKLSRISKAQIVEVYARGTSPDGRDYEILEFIKHGTLADFGKDGLPETKVRDVLRELTDAVAALHAENILHRDLKPANVLVRTIEPLDLVLTDFGISSVMDISLHVTSVSRTAAYSAPEAMTGVVSKASDWWSVGIISLELLTGRHPFRGLDERAVNFALVMRGITVPKEIPAAWQSLLKGLLTRDHAKRWGAEQVQQWMAGKKNIPVHYEAELPHQGTTQQRHRPYKLLGKDYFDPQELAVGLAENWDEAVKQFGRRMVTDWVSGQLSDQQLANVLMDIAEDKNLNGEQKLAAGLVAMNEQLPLTWRGSVLNREWLIANATGAVEIFESGLMDWMVRLRKDGQLKGLQKRFLEAQRTLKRYGLSVETGVAVSAALADAAEVQKLAADVQREYCSSRNNPELGKLLSLSELEFPEALVLALAPPSLFERREAVATELLKRFESDLKAPSAESLAAISNHRQQVRDMTAKLEILLKEIFGSWPVPTQMLKRWKSASEKALGRVNALLEEHAAAEWEVNTELPRRLTEDLDDVKKRLGEIEQKFSDIDSSQLRKSIGEWEAFYGDIGKVLKSYEQAASQLPQVSISNAGFRFWPVSKERKSISDGLAALEADIANRRATLEEPQYRQTRYYAVAQEAFAKAEDRLRGIQSQLKQSRKRDIRNFVIITTVRIVIACCLITWTVILKHKHTSKAPTSPIHSTDTVMSDAEIAAKASEKRIELTGAAMRRAGFGERQITRSLSQGGSVVTWGHHYNTPPNSSDVVAIAAGTDHFLALKQDGTVVAWGVNNDGQCAIPPGLNGVVAVAAGGNHSLALKKDGTVVAGGANFFNQFDVPPGLNDVVAIAAGALSLALKQDGTVVAWPIYAFRQGTVPPDLTGAVAIAAGGAHFLALKDDGTVVAWGENSIGQCNVPSALSNVVAVAAGQRHSLALKQDGTVVAWGCNDDGQCNVPPGLSGVIAIAAGWWHSVALRQDGTVAAWGKNDSQECEVPHDLTGVAAITAGNGCTLALKLTNSVDDYPESVKNILEAAQQGDAEAQFNLGKSNYTGNGMLKDYAEAVKWFRKAADQGNAKAQNNLGVCYNHGEGVAQDYSEAINWFSKAAAQGFPQAQANLGSSYFYASGVAQDYSTAARWYRKSAEQGYASAQYSLGTCYNAGTGVAQDYSEAIKWWSKAAEQGYADAQFSLAAFYYAGKDGKTNYSAALKWYQKAAEQGNINSCDILGGLYAAGIGGVKEDYNESAKWFRKAAENGDATAEIYLGKFYWVGKGVGQNYAEAVNWFRKASEQGSADGDYYLGVCYLDGNGVAKNTTEALKWLLIAFVKGQNDAPDALDKIIKSLPEKPQAKVQQALEAARKVKIQMESLSPDEQEKAKRLMDKAIGNDLIMRYSFNHP